VRLKAATFSTHTTKNEFASVKNRDREISTYIIRTLSTETHTSKNEFASVKKREISNRIGSTWMATEDQDW